MAATGSHCDERDRYRCRRVRRLLLTGLLLALATAPTAAAGPLDDFRRDGQIDPCRYSDQELRNGLNGLPPDVKQYAPGLADQLAGGREGCGGNAPGSTETRESELVPALPGGGGTDAKAKVPSPPSPKPTPRFRLADVDSPAVDGATLGSDAPGWLLPLLLVLAAVGGLAGLARVRGTSADRLARPLRASFAEAGGRTADAFAELWDSVRMGRGT